MAFTNAERQRRYRERNPGRAAQNWRRYSHTKKGIITLLLNAANDRAKIQNLPFDLDREWLEEKVKKGVCEFSGIKLQKESTGDHKSHPFTPSLDRIIPSIGYTKENTRLVCLIVNRAKCDWQDGTLILLAKAIVQNQP